MTAPADTKTGWILGTMSGTSADGIDLALLRTDGDRMLDLGPTGTGAYSRETRDAVLALARAGRNPSPEDAFRVSKAVTADHLTAIRHFLTNALPGKDPLRLIGFHGQTVFHDPSRALTVQLGDPQTVATTLGLPVIGHMRHADLAAGGQGAPIVPAYHATLATALAKPLAIVNIGGVSNATLLTSDGRMFAADLGPGNAPLDDWMARHTGASQDEDGVTAARGVPDQGKVEAALAHPFYRKPAPKSLDRADFSTTPAEGLSLEDGAATLLAVTVGAVAKALDWMPEQPRQWLICGGGRHNATLMTALADALPGSVLPVEAVGWDGDSLEAQAMAFLAARSVAGFPTTWPQTTGCHAATIGGVRFDP